MRVFSIQKSLSITVVFLLVLSLVFAFAASCSQDPSTTTPAPTTTPPATTPVPTTTPPPTTTPAEPHDGLPLVNFNTPNFAGSSNCAACHRNLIDQSGKDVSMDHQWRSTMMANAARDPYFTAKVSAEIKNAPHLQQVIEDTCSTCHTPMARTEEVAQGNQGLLFGSGFLNPANSLHQAGIDGVSCTVCHQIQPEGLGQEATFGGQYIIDTLTPRPERVIFSQFPDPEQQIMAVSSGFKPVYGEHLGESALCATCHTVITPYLDAQGEVQGTFFEQSPFLEWAHSRYYDDISCQVCHMPAAAGNTKTASMPTNMEPKYPFSQHIFVGGNVQMLEILRDNPDELGVTASTEHFNFWVECSGKCSCPLRKIYASHLGYERLDHV